MGWWRNDDGDTVGDGPADRVSVVLDRLTADLGRKLRVGELLRAIAAVVEAKSTDVLAPGETLSGDLAARIEVDEEAIDVVVAESGVDQRIRDAIDDLCARISEEYETVVERRPTLSELLATFRFVLGYRAERRLELPELSSVRRIYVEAR